MDERRQRGRRRAVGLPIGGRPWPHRQAGQRLVAAVCAAVGEPQARELPPRAAFAQPPHLLIVRESLALHKPQTRRLVRCAALPRRLSWQVGMHRSEHSAYVLPIHTALSILAVTPMNSAPRRHLHGTTHSPCLHAATAKLRALARCLASVGRRSRGRERSARRPVQQIGAGG